MNYTKLYNRSKDKTFTLHKKISSLEIQNLITRGKEKYVRLRYMSDLWIRFKIQQFIVNQKDNEPEKVFPPVGFKEGEKSYTIDYFRLGLFNKLAVLMLLFRLSLIPGNFANAGTIYERQSGGNIVKGRKVLVWKKLSPVRRLINKAERLHYYSQQLDGYGSIPELPEYDEAERKLNIKLKEAGYAAIYLTQKGKTEVKRIYCRKGKTETELTQLFGKFGQGRLELYVSVGKMSVYYRLHKTGEGKVIETAVPQAVLFGGKRKAEKSSRRGFVHKIKYAAAVGSGLIMLALMPGKISAQNAVVRVIPQDAQSGANIAGVNVSVYDDNNNFVTSGVSTNEGITFGLPTSVEDVNTAAGFKFLPDGRIIYNLKGTSRVKATLTDILGRQTTLYEKTESGNVEHRININRLSNGNYTLTLTTDNFYAVSNFNKIEGKIYLNRANYVKNIKTLPALNRLPKGKGGLEKGIEYKFLLNGGNHFADSSFVFIVSDTTFAVPMDSTKAVHFELYNNDTDSLDVGYVKVNGDSLFVNGETDLSVAYSDTLKFVAGILTADSVYESTKRILPEELEDTVKVTAIDMYLRDMDGNVVGSLLDGRRVNPSIFKRFMNWSFFESDYNGLTDEDPGDNYDDSINRWSKSNNNEMPDSIVIYKYSDYGGTNNIMDQVTIDRLIDLYNTHLKPFFDEEGLSVPLVIDSTITYVVRPMNNNDILDNMAIIARGDMNVDGELSIYGEYPSTVRYNLIILRSGPPYYDPGELPGRRAALQELTGLEATRSPPWDNSVMLPGETIIHDYTSLTDYSLYDIKAFRIWHEMDWATGTKENDIMKLVGNGNVIQPKKPKDRKK